MAAGNEGNEFIRAGSMVAHHDIDTTTTPNSWKPKTKTNVNSYSDSASLPTAATVDDVALVGGADCERMKAYLYDGAAWVLQKHVYGSVELTDAATTDNMLIRRCDEGPTRIHVEPNSYVDQGTVTKLDLMIDPFNDYKTDYRIVNLYTKTGSTSSGANGQNGVAVLGVKGTGNHFGVWPSLNIGFSDDAQNGVPLKVMYFDTSDTEWRPDIDGIWREGKTVLAGGYMLNDFKLYKSAAGGVSGATEPTHTTGVVSDGAVDWEFIRDYSASSSEIKPLVMIGDRNDMPKFGYPDARSQQSKDHVVWNGAKNQYLDNSDNAVVETGVKLNTDDYYISSLLTGAGLRFDASGSFIQSNGWAWTSTPKAETSLASVVDAKECEHIVFGNASATDITKFEGLRYQRFIVESTNGQTTLKNTANIILADGTDLQMNQNEIYMFVMNASGTVARQLVG